MTKHILPVLPESTVKELQSITGKPLYAYIQSLRDNGWPLRSIASALGVSKSTVSNWQTRHDPETPVPVTVSLPKNLAPALNSTYHKAELEWEESLALLMLTKRSQNVRRYTAAGSDGRVAAKELREKLHIYRDRGVSLAKLAEACGISRGAVASKLKDS